jgi:hypothetical protein
VVPSFVLEGQRISLTSGDGAGSIFSNGYLCIICCVFMCLLEQCHGTCCLFFVLSMGQEEGEQQAAGIHCRQTAMPTSH